MSVLPSGAVTLLFTDIEGSTQLLRHLGDRYAEALAHHHRLLRQTFAAHDGHEVDNQGDSFFVAFSNPLDAVLAAAQAQQALFVHPWPEGGAVRVRMGLHTGEPLLTEDRDRYLGLDVHQAARIEAAAHGGQVLLSETTVRLVQERLPEGLELRLMGAHRLKDFEQSQSLFQLLIEGLPSSFPPLRSAPPEPDLEGTADRGAGIPALVGRETELGLLRERLRAARARRGSLVLLAGEPGIGKTRLAAELAGEAQQQGMTVLWGRCWEGEGAPAFWPWRQLLRSYGEAQAPLTLRAELGLGAAAVAQLVPELAEGLGERTGVAAGNLQSGGDPEAARFRLFDAVSRFLLNASQARPLLLLLDDLHWADKASLLLLQFLSGELGAAKLLIVGTYRDTDLDRRHPLAEVLSSLRRVPAFERLLLRGLSREEVERLLAVRAGHELDAAGARLAEALHQETEGNPFFIGEVLRHLAESGKLRQRNGRWIMAAASIAELGIPEGVREVIGRRLSRLSEETNRLLTVAAVIGRDFDATTLEQVGSLNALAVDTGLEEAEAAQVIASAGRGGRYRFAHALIRETLVAEFPTRRRERLHRLIGDTLETQYGARSERHAAELAAHFLEGNETDKALFYSRLAAKQEETSTAWEDAARHYEHCLTLLAELGTDSIPPPESQSSDPLQRDEAALLLALGRCQRNAGELRASWRSLMRAIDQYRSQGDATEVARATLESLEIYGAPERAARLALAALAGLQEDALEPELAVRLLAYLLEPHRTGWRPPAEEERLEAEAIDLVDRYRLTRVAPLLAFSRARRDSLRGRGREAAHGYRQAAGELAAIGDHRSAAEASYWAAVGTCLLGDLQEGQARIEETLALARAHHLHTWVVSAAACLAGLRLARGDWPGFDALAAEPGVARGFQWRRLTALRWTTVGALERAVASLPEPESAGGVPAWQVMVLGLRARVLWLAGEAALARGEWSRVREALPGDHMGAVVDGITLSRWAIMNPGEALPHLADASFLTAAERWLQEQESGGHEPVFDPFLCESARRHAAMVHLWCGHLEPAEEGLRQALAWCERERCPVEAGRCLQGLAEVAERRGQRDEALGDLERAAALFEQYGAKFYLGQVRATQGLLQG